MAFSFLLDNGSTNIIGDEKGRICGLNFISRVIQTVENPAGTLRFISVINQRRYHVTTLARCSEPAGISFNSTKRIKLRSEYFFSKHSQGQTNDNWGGWGWRVRSVNSEPFIFIRDLVKSSVNIDIN